MPTGVVYLLLGAALFYVFGRWSSDIFRRKNRSPVQGFALGVLGPAGVLIASFVPRADTKGKHHCVNCRRWIPDDALRCPHCRQGLKVAAGRNAGRFAPPSSPPPTPKVVGQRYDWTAHQGQEWGEPQHQN